MAKPPVIIDYSSTRERPDRRWLTAVIVLVVVAGAAILVAQMWLEISRGGNAYITYPGRLGTKRALSDIRDAVTEHLDERGSFPADLEELRASLHCRYSRNDVVRCDQILSDVHLMPVEGDMSRRLAGSGRFVLVLYLQKKGPMTHNFAVVVGEDMQHDPFFDDDIIRVFGAEKLAEWKQSPYQLP